MDNYTSFIPTASDFVTNFILFIFGGVFGLSYRAIRQRILDEIENRRMRLSGEFLSFFDDVENGQRIVHRSTSMVRQKGKRIVIKTLNKEGRSWELTGRIHNKMYLIGDYNADDIHDEGIGTFFLELRNRDYFDGFWHGYDHINHTLTGGKYWFIRKMSFELVRAKLSDSAAIVAIINEQLGLGYGQWIIENITDKDVYVIIAKDDTQVYGVGIARMLGKNELSEYLKSAPYDPMMSFFDQNGIIGVIQTIAVRGKFQKKGIGFTLFSSCEAHLVNKGAKSIIVPAWESAGVINISGILSIKDYEIMGSSEGHWRIGCDSNEFKCPSREKECICNCHFYRKMIYSHNINSM